MHASQLRRPPAGRTRRSPPLGGGRRRARAHRATATTAARPPRRPATSGRWLAIDTGAIGPGHLVTAARPCAGRADPGAGTGRTAGVERAPPQLGVLEATPASPSAGLVPDRVDRGARRRRAARRAHQVNAATTESCTRSSARVSGRTAAVATSAFLDLELKESARILATATLGDDRSSARFELQSGSSIGQPPSPAPGAVSPCNNPCRLRPGQRGSTTTAAGRSARRRGRGRRRRHRLRHPRRSKASSVRSRSRAGRWTVTTVPFPLPTYGPTPRRLGPRARRRTASTAAADADRAPGAATPQVTVLPARQRRTTTCAAVPYSPSSSGRQDFAAVPQAARHPDQRPVRLGRRPSPSDRRERPAPDSRSTTRRRLRGHAPTSRSAGAPTRPTGDGPFSGYDGRLTRCVGDRPGPELAGIQYACLISRVAKGMRATPSNVTSPTSSTSTATRGCAARPGGCAGVRPAVQVAAARATRGCASASAQSRSAPASSPSCRARRGCARAAAAPPRRESCVSRAARMPAGRRSPPPRRTGRAPAAPATAGGSARQGGGRLGARGVLRARRSSSRASAGRPSRIMASAWTSAASRALVRLVQLEEPLGRRRPELLSLLRGRRG